MHDTGTRDSTSWSILKCVCMGSLYCCIVACAHLGNGTGRRTATLVTPLLLTSGPVRYEAVRHSCGTNPVGKGFGTDF